MYITYCNPSEKVVKELLTYAILLDLLIVADIQFMIMLTELKQVLSV